MKELEKNPVVALMDDYGCLSCHSLTGPKGELIPLNGIYNRKRVVVKGGKEVEVTADEAYLKRALLQPSEEILKGQIEMMEPVEDLSEEQIQGIIDFLKELK